MQSSEDEEPDGEPVKMEQPVQNSEEEQDQGEAADTSHEEDASTDSESEESLYLCTRAKCRQVFDLAKELKRHEKMHNIK